MKRPLPLLLAALAVACSPSTPVADPSWEELSEPGVFSLEAPGSSKSQNISENAPQLGGTVTGKQYDWQPPSNRFYMAMYMNFPNPNNLPLNMQGAMKNIVAGIARRSQGSIDSEQSAQLSGIDGTESVVKMGNANGTLRIRAVERNGTIYLLAAGWPNGKEAPEDEAHFFNSFKLK